MDSVPVIAIGEPGWMNARWITKHEYAGGYDTLNRYLRPPRRLDAAARASVVICSPAVRQVTGWSTGRPSNLDPEAAVRLQVIRQR